MFFPYLNPTSYLKRYYYILFREKMSACAAVHMYYVVDACDRVRSKILLPGMMGVSFMVVILTRIIFSEPEH